MTRLRISLVALAMLASLALLAMWQVPQWLDWTRYRANIEVLAAAMLGKSVTIQGPITLTLLPQPVLTAAQVSVGGGGPTDFSIQVDALRLRVALWPLIAGRLDARELVVHGPNLRIPWPMDTGRMLPRPPDWLAAFAAHLAWQIARLDIHDPALCLRIFKSDRDAGLILFAGMLAEALARA